MKVFFASFKGPALRQEYKKIIKCMESLGHEVFENQFTDRIFDKAGKLTPQQVLERDDKRLKEADILVAEMTVGGFSEGYYYAAALSRRKPILLLYNRKKYNKAIHSDLTRGSSSELVSIEYYKDKNLTDILKKHLSGQKRSSLTKFNFIISPYIADYLDWVAHVKRKSRSDYLRDLVIKKVIERDTEYQKYLSEKRKNL